MSGLAPKLEILPDGQRQIWTRLDATPGHFVLYGGTALALGQIEPPDLVASNNVAIASLRDLMGTKCATIPQRAEMKDYVDIDALISRAGIDLSVQKLPELTASRKIGDGVQREDS
jgi:hypothetical protein